MASTDLIAILGFVALFGMMAIRVPIGIAMAISGVIGFAILTGNLSAAIAMFGTETAGALMAVAGAFQ